MKRKKTLSYLLFFLIFSGIFLSLKANANLILLPYKLEKGQTARAIRIYPSQIIWIYNNEEAALVKFTKINYIYAIDKRDAFYEYRYYNKKTKKIITGKGRVYETRKKGKKSDIYIQVGTLRLMWSSANAHSCYVYVVPNKFDLRILNVNQYNKYPLK